MKSKFRMGWLMVCFDLPTETAEQRKQATRFRKNLLDHGYFMLQYSIYVRNCVSYEKMQRYVKELRLLAPITGSISAFYLTDKQWQGSVRIECTDRKRSNRGIDAGTEQPKQITFW